MSFVERFQDATIGFSGYPRLARSRSGAFGYLALLLLIVLAIAGTIKTVQISRLGRDIAASVAAGPDFALQNGQFQFNGPMPYRVPMGGPTGPAIVIDTTGKTTLEAMKAEQPGSMLITRTSVTQMQPVGEPRTYDLSLYQTVSLTKADVVKLLGRMHWLVPFLYLLLYPFQLAFKALDAVVLALVALLYGSITRRRVEFEQGWKLGVYAVTLPTVIQWIWPGYTTIPLFAPGQFLFWWVLAILYLIMGLRASAGDLTGPSGPESI